MTESEVRKLLRRMKELDSQTAFRSFYDMTYDRLYRIAYYYVKREEWSQEIVLDVFLKLWEQRSSLPEVKSIEDYCFILVKNASLNYLKALDRLPERCREVFIRIREEKQSYAQVAEELGISTKTVDAQLQKATIRLKEAILTMNDKQ